MKSSDKYLQRANGAHSPRAKRNNHRSSGIETMLALFAVLLTLMLGFGIQYTLEMRDRNREEKAAEQIASDRLAALHALGSAEERKRQDAAERMQTLPEEKRRRLEELHLELLTIVSPTSPLEEDYTPELATVVEEYVMDSRCAAIVWDMMQDCRAEGAGFPMICSAYRTREFQQELFENKVIRVQLEHYCSIEEAEELAAKEVAVPGTSEHELGLAADIIDETYPYLNEWQETTGTQRWLAEHADDYGFILRYPNGTTAITGIIYEPWHYRYVGEKFAHEITRRGITLEEYVAWRRGR